MVNPNVFIVPADLQQALCKYKVLAAEYVYRPLSEAEAQDWSNAICLDKVRTDLLPMAALHSHHMQQSLTVVGWHADAAAGQVGPGCPGGPGLDAR